MNLAIRAIFCELLYSYNHQSHMETSNHRHLHECQAEVVGGAAPVHWVFHDVEGKACHLLIHQDVKVIT